MHGRFYTNLEDKDRTLSIDLKTARRSLTGIRRAAKKVSRLGGGPKAGQLFVACSTLAEVLDAGTTAPFLDDRYGDGVDDIYYAPATHCCMLEL